MSKRALSIASGILIAILAFSNAFAGNIKLSSVTFSIGSLISDGGLTGLGNTNVTLVLDGSGFPAITCINNGTNSVPGQTSPKVTATGITHVGPSSGGGVTKNGSSPYHVETGPITVTPPLTWQTAGCPNANWTWVITGVFWTNATITVKDSSTGFMYLQQNYTCYPALQTATSATCTLKP